MFIPILYNYCRMNGYLLLLKGDCLSLVVPWGKKWILSLLYRSQCKFFRPSKAKSFNGANCHPATQFYECMCACSCAHTCVFSCKIKYSTVYLFSWMPLFAWSPFFSKPSHTFPTVLFSFSLRTCQILPLPTEKFLACLSLCLYSCQHNSSHFLLSFLTIIPDWIWKYSDA